MSSLSPASTSVALNTQRPEQRVQGIDLMRGLCIIAVVLHHINLRIHFRESSLGILLGRPVERVLFWSGAYGVTVFFVISGFLITTWSLRRWGRLREISLPQFYQMRFARIVPCLVGLLVLLSILDRLGVPRFTINTQHTSLGRALVAALTFHINWLEARTGYLPAAWDVLWSLSVEEVFYVFFPLLCTLLRKQIFIILLLGCFVVIGPFARVYTQNQLWADYGYLSCMDGIALGCLAAIFAATVRMSGRVNLFLRLSGSLLAVFIIVFRGTVSRVGLYKTGLDVTLLELAGALFVIALQQSFEQRSQLSPTGTNRISRLSFLAAAPLRWFGHNSYEVYLTHMLVVWPAVMLFSYFHQNINMAPLWFIAATIVAGAAGYLAARFYSEPLNRRLRRKLFSSSKQLSAAG